MTKIKDEFPWKKSKYPIERILEKLLWEVMLLFKYIRKYIGRKPKDNFEKMIKALEVIIWAFLSYDLLKSVIGGR